MLQASTNGHDNLAIDPAFVERDAGISDVREIVGCADAGMEAVQGEEGEEVVYDGGRRRVAEESCEVDAVRDVLDGVEIIEDVLPAEDAGVADESCGRDGAQRVAEDARAAARSRRSCRQSSAPCRP